MGNNISIHEIEGNEQHAHELIKIMDDNQALPIQEIVSRLIEKWEGSKETFNLLKINLNETRRKELKTYCFPADFFIKVEINNYLYKIWKSPNFSWSLDYPLKKLQIYDCNRIKLSSNFEEFEVNEIMHNVLPLLQDPKLIWKDIIFNIIKYLEARFFGKWNVFILDREKDISFIQSELSLSFVEPKYNQLIKIHQQPGAYNNYFPEYRTVPISVDSNFDMDFVSDIIRKLKNIMYHNKAYENNLCNKIYDYLKDTYEYENWLIVNSQQSLIQNVINYKYLNLKYPNNLELTIYKVENKIGFTDEPNEKILSNIKDDYELIEYDKPKIIAMQTNMTIQLNQKIKDIIIDSFSSSSNLKKNIEYISDIVNKDVKSYGIFISPNPNFILKGIAHEYSQYKINLSTYSYYLFFINLLSDKTRNFLISNIEEDKIIKNSSEIQKIIDDIIKTITVMSPEYHNITLFPDYSMTANYIKYNVAPLILQNKKENNDIMSVFTIPMSEQEGDEIIIEM